MKKEKSLKPSNRIEKVNSLIQQELAIELRLLLEEEKALVTVTKVETSRDLKWAKVWISIIGGDDDRILRHIEKNIYELQGQINRTLNMKIVPRLQFFLDTSPRYAQHIDSLLKKIEEEETQE